MNPMLRRLSICILALACWLCQANPASAENLRETPIVKTVRKCAPTVVNIGTEQRVLLQKNPFWGQQFGSQMDASHKNFFQDHNPVAFGNLSLKSLGSGIVVSPDGLIVTNAHVAGMASKIFVTMPDGAKSEAILIGTDNANDLALIQVYTKKPLAYLEIADDVLIGETVISIGNPLGLENSVSAGIVSGTNRTFYTQPQIESFKDLIQTDASINQGSSGGALVNLEGKLTGMNMAVMQNAQGLGFAIPAKKIKRMLEEYEKVRKDTKASV